MAAIPETTTEPWPIGRLLNWTTEYLADQRVDDARLAAEVLLAHAADCRRIDLYARFDRMLDDVSLARFRECVRRAAGHEPIAYLVEQKEFFSLPFRVTPDVLIPRSETEVLVECALDQCAKAGVTRPRLLDLGTGSGCIAVTLLVQLTEATAVATDLSAAALDVARFNAERHGVSDRIVFAEADRLALSTDLMTEGGFDLLLSNPPYVPAGEVDQLDSTVRDYEPAAALTDGEDGLSFYRSVAAGAATLLAPGGWVMVEVGNGQASQVVEVVQQGGALVHRQTRKDRVVGAERVLMFSLREGPVRA